MVEQIKARAFYYVLRPIMNRIPAIRDRQLVACPMCGECLQHYDKQGFLHLIDGDADCYGALGAGKGSFK